MHLITICCVLLVLCTSVKQIAAQSTQKPYAFGFTIDKQQHRSEKRDERGIVMGEFGFITADGIYHVTVYATDEEGKFRILAMRSYPYEEKPKTIEMILKPKPRAAITTTTARAILQPLAKHNFANAACSGCFLTNNAPKRNPSTEKVSIRPLSRTLPSTDNIGTNGAAVNGKKLVQQVLPQVLSNMQHTTTAMQQAKTKIDQKLSVVTPIKTKTHETAENKINTLPQKSINKESHPAIPKHTLSEGREKLEALDTHTHSTKTQSTKEPHPISSTPHTILNTKTTTTRPHINHNTKSKVPSGDSVRSTPPINSKTPTSTANFPKIPLTNTNNAIPVTNTVTPKATSGDNFSQPRKAANNPKFRPLSGSVGDSVGEVERSKNVASGGKTANAGGDTGDLYRFKYTLDYNGHEETGSRNGNKQGSFFAIGDDNVERTIEYIANEFGFQPRIRWRKLDKPVQTKENTLKDYEFVWFKKP